MQDSGSMQADRCDRENREKIGTKQLSDFVLLTSTAGYIYIPLALLDSDEWEIQISDKCLIPFALVLQQGL